MESIDRKKLIKKIAPWVAIAIVTVLLAALPALAKTEDESGSTIEIKSAEASLRDMDTILLGGGQLESSGVFNLKIPENVKIKEFLVGNGDTVEEGDPIAIVDSVSVMSAIAGVQETLDELEDQIATASSESTTSTITSTPAGTVKAVYAKTGDDVGDVMLENGSLAVISLDGTMAVQVESETELSAGDKVNVTIGDKQVAGRVKSNVNGVITVTVDDNKYEIGESAAVYTTDDSLVGVGTLYVYSAWNVTGYSGTVTSVNISKNQSVYEGQSLFGITETGKNSEYQKALDKRQKYEQMMQELFVMYTTGYITAPCDGIVSGVDTTATYMLSYDEEDTGFSIVFLTDTAPEYSVSLLSNEETVSGEQLNGAPGGQEGNAPGEGGGGEQPEDPTVISILPTTLTSAKLNQSYTANMSLYVPEGQTAPENGTWYLSVGPKIGSNLTIDSATGTISGTPAKAGTYSLLITYSYDNGAQNVILLTTLTVSDGNVPGGGGMPSGGGGMSGGMSGMTGFSTEEEDDGLYGLGKVTVATVTSQEEMSLSITVDELDITKVYVGQKAMISMNSFANEPVEAEVVNIGNSGENNGGNSKFTVKLQLEKSSDMLPGMNATATITLDTAENALCVPSAAIYELNGDTFVYTSYDVKNKVLSTPVAVKVGIADANYVQILEGIEENTTVFYEVYE